MPSVFPFFSHPSVFWGVVEYFYQANGIAENNAEAFAICVPTPCIEAVLITVNHHFMPYLNIPLICFPL